MEKDTKDLLLFYTILSIFFVGLSIGFYSMQATRNTEDIKIQYDDKTVNIELVH